MSMQWKKNQPPKQYIINIHSIWMHLKIILQREKMQISSFLKMRMETGGPQKRDQKGYKEILEKNGNIHYPRVMVFWIRECMFV